MLNISETSSNYKICLVFGVEFKQQDVAFQIRKQNQSFKITFQEKDRLDLIDELTKQHIVFNYVQAPFI